MTWIDDNKSQSPWSCPDVNKPRYNEGTSIKHRTEPIWEVSQEGKPVITTVHNPCGYWFKGPYVPPASDNIFEFSYELLTAQAAEAYAPEDWTEIKDVNSYAIRS